MIQRFYVTPFRNKPKTIRMHSQNKRPNNKEKNQGLFKETEKHLVENINVLQDPNSFEHG